MLMRDPTARREFDIARRIHASMRENQSDRPEVLDALPEETAARGRRLARQVGLAFIVLVAMNVLLGLVYIAHQESKNPNRQLLNEQSREHLQKSLENAAATLTPPPIGFGGLQLTTEAGQTGAVADEIARVAQKFLGSGTKAALDNGRIDVVVEIPGKTAPDFKNALSLLLGVKGVAGEISPADPNEKVSVIVHLTEAK
jgi:hypothetical protein